MISQPLSGLDVAFLSLDDASAPLNNSALLVFEPAASTKPEDLVEVLAERAADVPELRRCVRSSWFPPGAAHWVEDPYFQARAHIRLVRPAPDGTRSDIAEYVAAATARPLDRSRPLWEIHVITGLSEGMFAILFKVHHALADGVGLYLIATALFDGFGKPSQQTENEQTENEEAENEEAENEQPESNSALGDLWGRLAAPHRWPGALVSQAKAGLATATKSTRDAGIAASVLRNARPAARSPLSGNPVRTPARRQLTTVRLEADTVRRIREEHRVSSNDVVLSVLAGGLRTGLPGLEEVTLRALIPVNLRSQDAGPEKSNDISGYLCELPVSDPDPLRRLQAVHTAMKRNKTAGPYKGAGALPFLANQLPAVANRIAAPLLSSQAGLLFDLVVTNVALPDLPLRVGGAQLREIYPSVPLGKGQALSVGVARYRDSIDIAVLSDPAILPDAEKLASTLPAAVEELVLATERYGADGRTTNGSRAGASGGNGHDDRRVGSASDAPTIRSSPPIGHSRI